MMVLLQVADYAVHGVLGLIQVKHAGPRLSSLIQINAASSP
jgi:hypothetical protein